MIKEYTIDKPFATKDNIRPVTIAEQAEVAFWFERSENNEPVYTEVSLVDPAEPTKVIIRMNEELER